MEPAVIVFIVLLGGYTAALLYLNSKVRSDEGPLAGVDQEHGLLVARLNGLLKTGVSAAGVAILGLFGMMCLMALLWVYAALFDPHLLE
jgi:hypothetical protein